MRKLRRFVLKYHRLLIAALILLAVLAVCIALLINVDSLFVPDKTAQISVTPTPPMDITPEATDAPTPIATARTIIVDPGHGGIDLGCVHAGINESDVNLSIGLLLRDLLTEIGYTVIMTRETDLTIALTERCTLIKTYTDADMFISIHQNTIPNDTVTNGTETWYNTDNSEENAVFAEYIQSAMVETLGSRDRGTKVSNNLAVIKQLTVPGCLVECGFLSNPEERGKLTTDEYQMAITQAVLQAVDRFWGRE